MLNVFGSILLLFFVLVTVFARSPPNVVFVMVDDVGWSDFGYNFENSSIPTPNIDRYARKGIQMRQYYTFSVCTPSRASLMTGRYHINTGVNYALTLGTPAGMAVDIPTLPQLLKTQNYAAHMVGKWHLGHSQQKQTPVGRGFDSFVGLYTRNADQFTRQFYSVVPWWSPLFLDWTHGYGNGSTVQYAEPLHTTEAVTKFAKWHMDQHVMTQNSEETPLFLYLAYTAAHSPTQPMAKHVAKCAHVPHLWRRNFCGLVVGIDDAMEEIVTHARITLGDNIIVVLTSDNGGSPWFGAMNEPLRGTKATAFEGGVRVPALFLDFAQEAAHGAHLGDKRVLDSMMHVSDWLPTILDYAGVPAEDLPAGLDGMSFRSTFDALYSSDPAVLAENQVEVTSERGVRKLLQRHGPRQEVLIEMHYEADFFFHEDLEAYRLGDYKLIKGIIRDPHYYQEPVSDRLRITPFLWFPYAIEMFGRLMESPVSNFGTGPVDTLRIVLLHTATHHHISQPQRRGQETQLRLYNIVNDPSETTNLAADPQYQPIIEAMEECLRHYNATRPPLQYVWMQLRPQDFIKTFVKGDCSRTPNIPEKDCVFTVPWIDNDADPWSTQEIVDATVGLNNHVAFIFAVLIGSVVLAITLAYFLLFRKK